jgi:aryl-alcohol dehydrogenase-like predicted oxidoreductase
MFSSPRSPSSTMRKSPEAQVCIEVERGMSSFAAVDRAGVAVVASGTSISFGVTMNYRTLGRTALKISEVALGCSGYWGNRRFSEKKAVSIVRQAFDHGVNFFDTGHNYSAFHAEPRLGHALKPILSTHARSKIVISSKAGTLRRSLPPPFPQRHIKDFSPDYIESACAKSIRNLNCGYLDIFHLHGISPQQLTDELVRRLERMKSNGMFRYLGINTHVEADMRFAAATGIFDVVLTDFNVMQLDRIPVIEELHDAGIGIIVGNVLGQGHLIENRLLSARSAADLWCLARTIATSSSWKLAKTAPAMRSVLSSISEMTAAQAAVSFVLENKAVSSCIFGTTRPTNLFEVVASSGKSLADESKNAIRMAYAKQSARISA